MKAKWLIPTLLLISFWTLSECCVAEEVTASYGKIETLYNKVRIPKMLVAKDGTVLAFGNNGRELRRSMDNGKTWSEPDHVDKRVGSAVVDTTTGDILVVHPIASSFWRSSDNGKTWKQEEAVVKSNALGHGAPDSQVPADTLCSESGITLEHGEHKGRLLMPARLMAPKGNNGQEWWPYHYNSAIYSDDHGKTWQTAGPVQGGTGEGTLAEFSDGVVYYNSRSHLSIDHRRQIAHSYDGGHMYTDWRVDEYLREVGQPFYFKYGRKPSYGISAGLVRLPLEVTNGKDVLVLSMPDTNGGDRKCMTVFASFDRGQTWPVKRLVYEGPSAYSSLTASPDGTIYLLFESGDKKQYERLDLVRMNLDWILQGEKTGSGEVPDWAKEL